MGCLGVQVPDSFQVYILFYEFLLVTVTQVSFYVPGCRRAERLCLLATIGNSEARAGWCFKQITISHL